MRRQRLIIAAVALAMVAVGAGVQISRSLGGGFTVGPGLLSQYQVTYQVENGASAGPANTSWEVLTVRRPYGSADLTYSRRPGPGVAPTGGSAADQHVLYSLDSAGAHQVAARQPGPPPGDQYLLQEMPDLLSRGLARDRGRQEVLAGRTCRLYSLFEPPAGPIKALDGADNHDEVCLDQAGLELSEQWTYNGHLVLRREAVLVRTYGVELPSLSGASPPKDTSVVPTAVEDPHPQSFLRAPTAPPGFRAAVPVRYVFPDPQSPGQLLAASVVWAFTQGSHVVTVEAGQEAGGQLPWQSNDTVTRSVTLSGLGPATTAMRSDGPEVRVAASQGWIRVRGTVPLAALVSYAQSLRLGSG
ncbi:MAG TPA: hypothetical protein VE990_12220 [Acidimicrobiales bacterium]|nr:hypothetical protein [Acidimicrobiales bacterium]